MSNVGKKYFEIIAKNIKYTMRARKRRTRIQTLTNSDYQFNPFSPAMEKKLRNADKKRGIKAKYDIKYLNGDRYIGETDDGFFGQTQEGQGIYYFNNGDRYEGNYKNDVRDGKGICYFKDGSRYDGDWKDDNKEGKGTLYYPDEKIKYYGEFKNDYLNGKGTYYYQNGDRYVGDWKNNKRNGKGIYYYKNGDIYVGDWKNNKRNGKGTYCYKDGNRCEVNYKNGILINGKKYYKSTPKNRKDVMLQINENDSKEIFLSKHKDGDFIYTDDSIDKTVTHEKETYDHLKIMYSDHGDKNRKLTKNIDQKKFTEYQNKELKSVYVSSTACHGGFYDSNGNNLFDIVKNMMKTCSDKCVGFVSLAKAKNILSYDQTTNENGKKGAKRVPKKKENIVENISDQNYDKNNDFEYYCIIQEDGEYKIYQIPYQLCYWREYLIDEGKLMEAFNTLKEGKDYEFEAEVILNDGKSTKTTMKITIPSKWGVDKNTIKEVNPEEEQEIESNKSNHSSANINLKDLNKQNQLGE